VFDTMPSGFFVLDEEWHFAFLNPASEAMLQRHPESLIGQEIWEAFPEAVGSDFQNVYRRVMESGISETFIAHFAPLDTTFNVSAHRTPRGIAVHFRDVTVQEYTKRQAERSAADLRKTHDRLTSVANVAPVGLYEFRLDPSGEVSFPYCSERFCDMLGVEQDALQGKPEDVFERVNIEKVPHDRRHRCSQAAPPPPVCRQPPRASGASSTPAAAARIAAATCASWAKT
jgi:PAS domain-containing protein